jgi:hypothetical protein
VGYNPLSYKSREYCGWHMRTKWPRRNDKGLRDDWTQICLLGAGRDRIGASQVV